MTYEYKKYIHGKLITLPVVKTHYLAERIELILINKDLEECFKMLVKFNTPN